MKAFKLIDIIISSCLIVAGIVAAFSNWGWNVLYFYVIVGGWQVISMIVHEVDRRFVGRGTNRRTYHNFALWFLILGGIFILFRIIADSYIFLLFLMIAAVLSPFMAIYYTMLCIQEWKTWENMDKEITP